MAAHYVSDAITLGVAIRDEAGELADATAVTCTVTLPDATTETPTVTSDSTGLYTATVTPLTVGRYLVHWVATGDNACTFSDYFDVALFSPASELLTTPARVAAKMHVEVPTDGPDMAALDEAIQEASGIVLNHLNRDTVLTLRAPYREAIAAVTTRVAMRLWRNPADLGSESYNDHSQSWSDPRLLTGDEVRALSRSVARVRGPIILIP